METIAEYGMPRYFDPAQVLAEARTAGRGAIQQKLGAFEAFRAVPEEWSQRAAALGKWPARLAELLSKLNGRWWRWRWRGTAKRLWREVVRIEFPGLIGRDNFRLAWNALREEGLLAWIKGGWRCVTWVTSGLVPRDLAPKDRAGTKNGPPTTRAGDRLLVISPISRSQDHTDLVSKNVDGRRLGQDPPRPTASGSARVRKPIVGGRDPFGSPSRPPERPATPPPEKRPRPSRSPEKPARERAPVLGSDWALRLRSLADRGCAKWGASFEFKVMNSGGTLYRIIQASAKVTDEEWNKAVDKLVQRDHMPGSPNLYLAGIIDRMKNEETREGALQRERSPNGFRKLPQRRQKPSRRQDLLGGIAKGPIKVQPSGGTKSEQENGKTKDPPQGRQGAREEEARHAQGLPKGVSEFSPTDRGDRQGEAGRDPPTRHRR